MNPPNEGYSVQLTFERVPLNGGCRRVQELVLPEPAAECKVVVYRYRRIGWQLRKCIDTWRVGADTSAFSYA